MDKMDNKQPIKIQRGTFVCDIYDVGNLMQLPLTSIRKLWKIMFSAEDENRETIQIIKDWLPLLTAECAERIPQAEVDLATAKADAVWAHSESALAQRDALKAAQKRVTAAKAAHVKAQKLQAIFNEFTTK